ncbi:MAG: tRNA (adenosine(37)-N6)-threonylcarbamoyltransferase complex dimerization subunit type 1 TsaB [Oscillospiraceae bacterium]|jgi:tRNA threonylcarbamoyladenosine biosynthesis protein TsaB|nr:tRNA (adenosine(37)-N6)-threonylcarbamoyltransferase complex dimerization subunit type 1 TsaB [Oscillospiraceae bacterium]
MRILSLDTSGASISVAAIDGARVVFEAFERTGQTHSARLLTLVECALTAAGWSVGDVERIAVVVGPGSYTGVRIGVSTARGLAQALGIPCVGLDALEALAAQAVGLGYGLVCPLLDARAGQVYGAAFDCGGDAPKRLMGDEACPLDTLLDAVQARASADNRPIVFTGEGAAATRGGVVGRFGERALILPESLLYPRASAAALLAMNRPVVAYNELIPLYLRAPQAERERIAREGV